MCCSGGRVNPIKLVGALLAVALVGCGSPPAPEPIARRTDHPDAAGVVSGDREMEAAMSKARDSIDQFLDLLDKAKDGDGAIVKASFPTASGKPEYMWVY